MVSHDLSVRAKSEAATSAQRLLVRNEHRERRLRIRAPQILVTPGLVSFVIGAHASEPGKRRTAFQLDESLERAQPQRIWPLCAHAPGPARRKGCQEENFPTGWRADRRGSDSSVSHGRKHTPAAKNDRKTGESFARRSPRDEKGRAPHLKFDCRRRRDWFSNPTRIEKSCHNGGASNESLPAPRSSAGPDNAALHGRNGKYNF